MAPLDAAVPPLLRHSRREQWGLGVMVDRGGDRVNIQFQDGRARTFKEGYYHLFEAVDRRLDVALGIVEALHSMSGQPARVAGSRRQPVTLEEQVEHFAALFPEGFRGDDYVEAHRGDERRRPLKRHRDHLVARAAEALSSRAIKKAINASDPAAVLAAAGEVVAATDLVKVAERKRFLDIKKKHHEAVADALFALLHGRSALTPRFDAWVATLERALGAAPSWELATVLVGAAHPDAHVVVRESVFTRQAVFMAPGLTIPSRPMGILYERLLALTVGVRDALVEADLEPRDLFDVQDFMWLTLKPAAQRAIRERRRDAELAPRAGRAEREAA